MKTNPIVVERMTTDSKLFAHTQWDGIPVAAGLLHFAHSLEAYAGASRSDCGTTTRRRCPRDQAAARARLPRSELAAAYPLGIEARAAALELNQTWPEHGTLELYSRIKN